MKLRLIMMAGTPQEQGECVDKCYLTRDIEVGDEFKSLRARGFGVIGAEELE